MAGLNSAIIDKIQESQGGCLKKKTISLDTNITNVNEKEICLVVNINISFLITVFRLIPKLKRQVIYKNN